VPTYRFRAQYVVPIASPPIRDGWVSLRNGRVAAFGAGRAPSGTRRGDAGRAKERDLGRVAILPGLINAHTHLELSRLWGKVRPADSLPSWVDQLLALRGSADRDDPVAIEQAITSMEEAGTAAVGDVSNTLASVGPLVHSRLHAVVFRELVGFRARDAEGLFETARGALSAWPPHARIRIQLAAHAPYSTSPQLIQAVARAAIGAGDVTSIHLGESAEEVRFLAAGDGPWRTLLERLGVWDPAWRTPACGPVEYLERLGVLGRRLLVVHGVHLSDHGLSVLAREGVTLVTCPRSNRWVGAGDPPVARFYASGVRVAIGTDSLASATDLNMFAELAALHHLAPELPPSILLESATRTGAEALGLDNLGVIRPGALARLIAVDLPAGVRDVETYLVEGIDAAQVSWLDEPPAS
jgi:aminodeoxyfutalosine deaminase